jgi:hypothetical protein
VYGPVIFYWNFISVRNISFSVFYACVEVITCNPKVSYCDHVSSEIQNQLTESIDLYSLFPLKHGCPQCLIGYYII